ncbi:tetratricopeptide repeat protein [Vulcaniibacterium tengchongense]|uniref:Tetratricopeptide repeat protein n=1 Tax=Vulcaniibacterium tengchongense TaxID=1273429 RepID=A0A3N4V132_9GAMM|nr:hypothetical protein [Vulcaniibacterium tengchongense]RPE75883.1 hypothetical protein EDC50_2781 [Vulcaniibacterium tengchongense]
MNFFTSTALFVLLQAVTNGASTRPIDLDGDNKPDEIIQLPLQIAEDQASSHREIVLKLSSLRLPLRAHLHSDTTSLEVYPDHGSLLIVDHSERSSRDAAEFNYSVFRWSRDKNTLCLHAEVSGTPANQLQGERIPKEAEVTFYAPCAAFGGKTPPQPLAPENARRAALIELATLGKNEKIPEYLAIQLASIVDASNVAIINDAGYYQEQAGFLESALIILNAVHNRFPKRVVARLNLADTYWKLGNKMRACALYGEYLSAARKSKTPPSPHAIERAQCESSSH